MHITVAHLDTGAEVNLIHNAIILPGWRYSVKKGTRPRFREETKQLLKIEVIVTLHICRDDLCTRVGLL